MALTQIGSVTVHVWYNSSDYLKIKVFNNSNESIGFAYKDRSNDACTGISANATSRECTTTEVFTVFPSRNSTTVFVPITWIRKGSSYDMTFLDSDGSFKTVNLDSFPVNEGTTTEVPLFKAEGSAGISSINLSTVDPNTTIEALVDGTMTEINSTPKTVNITNGNVVVNVSTHSPKDKYTVQVNNGDNMLRIIDGSTQYTSFPVSIPVEANKTLTAYGEPDKEITINYTNTGTPVITNT